ncbi:transposase [Mesorhizobium australicum]|uniref:Transposase n=1 Tax=Mesorhizobium australicum TaxID=536018 RepID=A0ACC6T8Y4_9HYPH
MALSLAACLAMRWSSLTLMVVTEVGAGPLQASRRDDHGAFAGIDVSLEYLSVCVVDASGKIVRETRVASEPEALIAWFASLDLPLAADRAGSRAAVAMALCGDAAGGLAVELLETRNVRHAFKAMPVKSDRNDALGIAQLMRLGWFRPVHCKSLAVQEVRAVLTARKLIQSKLRDVENSVRILRGFGLKVGKTAPRDFACRIRELVAGHPNLKTVATVLLSVHAVLLREFQALEKKVRALVRPESRRRAFLLDQEG